MLRNSWPISTSPPKKCLLGILFGTVMQLYINLSFIDIFTKLCLLTHENCIFLHVFMSVIYFTNVFWSSVYKFCMSSVRFIHKYSIFLCYYKWHNLICIDHC